MYLITHYILIYVFNNHLIKMYLICVEHREYILDL